MSTRTRLSASEKAEKRDRVQALLDKAGLSYRTRKGGVHFVVTTPEMTVDVWPGTDRYRVTGSGKTHEGIEELIRKLQQQGS